MMVKLKLMMVFVHIINNWVYKGIDKIIIKKAPLTFSIIFETKNNKRNFLLKKSINKKIKVITL